MTAATVDEYLTGLPEDVAAIVERLRALVHAAVPDAGETISYGMPTFTLDGLPLVHLAAWKKHIALYPLPAMDDDLARDVAPFQGTKSTLRLPLGRPVPYDLVERVLAALVRQRGRG
ncbi:iron chaperone [Petropleomorpha daqingensis]|uniref:Uncharacterized protein YdhG (YjbR/CyaY superfamily) n=1 Tax=Petropleomorpha daqingensis TaxID=2026353 RepID=A0A853CLA8_9ACTN|nr:DUF1801 domain-containing protein [Petropleomorpha daqingensis]NYJ08357.1 uncharacterized protein YdhG (YjbR/CyaY superfamily) [Petropleomorpha daqingensis]